ncbi:MAG: phosphatase PAP2 family protein [Bacteroidales bacterium]|nr:phosphatase PAP2 family protein [Bacteroidales bacterium]
MTALADTASLVDALKYADKYATLAINDFDGPFTDAVMPLLSNRFVWIPLYLLLAVWLILRLGWRKALVVIIVVALSVGAIDQIANLVKVAVHRLRPCWDSFMTDNGLRLLEKRGSRFGFFSAHAATTAGVATAVLYFLKHWSTPSRRRTLAWIFALWVAAISISRIYVGKHFLGDIIAGAFAGIIIARVISWAVRLLINKYFVKFVN